MHLAGAHEMYHGLKKSALSGHACLELAVQAVQLDLLCARDGALNPKCVGLHFCSVVHAWNSQK